MKPILEVQHISKQFKIGVKQESYLSLRDFIAHPFKKKEKNDKLFLALEDINFNVFPGESIGIIGRNGAGKSTLLKILSKITPPTSGKIICRGRIASLLEVGTGFHQELTGRENIYMNGSILGMRKFEIERHFDSIVDFSGVEKFLDTPLKRYSSGMQLRLAFAVAAFLEPEILIIDEVLAVGDAEFQKKCLGKMDEVSKSGRTVLFVSHDMGAIIKLCKKSIILNNGKLILQDETSKVVEKYLQFNSSGNQYIPEKLKVDNPVYFKKIIVYNEHEKDSSDFTYSSEIKIQFTFGINHKEHPYNLFVTIMDKLNNRIFSAETKIDNEKMTLQINPNFLVRGSYSIHSFIHIPRVEQIESVENVCHFNVVDTGSIFSIHGNYDYGNVFGNYNWI
jgi:lipopolysaccharide transport system ATP-binding protein